MNTPDNSNIGYFVEADPKNPDEILEKTKNFPYAPEKKEDWFWPFYTIYEWKQTKYFYTKKGSWFLIGLTKKLNKFFLGCWNFMLDMECSWGVHEIF